MNCLDFAGSAFEMLGFVHSESMGFSPLVTFTADHHVVADFVGSWRPL